VGPARFASAGRRRLALLFASASFGRLVSGASTRHIAAAVTLVGACGVPDSKSWPALGGASDADPPRLLRLEEPSPESFHPLTFLSLRRHHQLLGSSRLVAATPYFASLLRTVQSSMSFDAHDQYGSVDLLRQNRRPYVR
jgi:hypothetical protein